MFKITEANYKLNPNEILSKVDAILLVYDVTKTFSFHSLDKWNLEIAEKSNYRNIPMMLVGNKTDLIFMRNVDIEEGEEKAFKFDALFEETSCVNDVKETQKPFKNMLSKLILNDLNDENRSKLRKSVEGFSDNMLSPIKQRLKFSDKFEKLDKL